MLLKYCTGCYIKMEQLNNGVKLRFHIVNNSSSYVPEEEVKLIFLFYLFVCWIWIQRLISSLKILIIKCSRMQLVLKAMNELQWLSSPFPFQ